MLSAAQESRIREAVRAFDFQTLFIDDLGWDIYRAQPITATVDGVNFALEPIAQKRGMVAFLCRSNSGLPFPEYQLRLKIERQVSKSVREHLIIFIDELKSRQTWQWVRRQIGKPVASRELAFYKGQSGEALVQKLRIIKFNFEEEESLSIVDVDDRASQAFDVETVTRHFYDSFKLEHDAFMKLIRGLPTEFTRNWYTSVMLNRLMFAYFIQKKGFLNGDINYLRSNLGKMSERDKFYSNFLEVLFFEGLAKKDRPEQLKRKLGDVPYVNGGLFLRHPLEETYGRSIQIPDSAFERLFRFFDSYQWYLDDRPFRNDHEINPNVLGYIFEKYINQETQQKMGAYYTKEDITEYICKYTILPFILESVIRIYKGEEDIWRLLKADPSRYVYPETRKGLGISLLREVSAGFADFSARQKWNEPSSVEMGLPRETWRETIQRQTNCQKVFEDISAGKIRSADDIIANNLDIRQFVQDIIDNCEDPKLLETFWSIVVGSENISDGKKGISVIDPACGSGAFLFAAMNVLQPLYESCLNRMEVFLDELPDQGAESAVYAKFRLVLEQVSRHPNRLYFVFKTIVLHNLYGVDLLEEAVEICKLRLYLKLIAQVDNVNQVEPLPDIDFNIRSGNSLVGFISRENVTKTLTTIGKAQTKLLSPQDIQTMKRIDEACTEIDEAFHTFQEMQLETTKTNDLAQAKSRVTNSLEALEAELNQYLATEYSITPKSYDEWLDSYRPFHWFVEFYSIIAKGGFDVIIGNPPYVEYKDSVKRYRILNYDTEACGNLFAYFVERSDKLAHESSRLGMILPLSAFSTDRMIPLISHVSQNSSLHVSNFSWRPGRLFDTVNLPLSILIQKIGAKGPCYTTRYTMWDSEARDFLFSLIQYSRVSEMRLPGSIPKLGSEIASNIMSKLHVRQGSIADCVAKKSKNKLYYRRGGLYWKVFIDSATGSSEEKILPLAVDIEKYAIIAALSSSLWFWYFTATSDCRHLGNRDIDTFPFDPRQLDKATLDNLTRLGKLYVKDLKANAEDKVRVYKSKKRVDVLSFRVRESKPIIDQIDQELGKYFGFTPEELDFVMNFEIKFRTSAERDLAIDSELV